MKLKLGERVRVHRALSRIDGAWVPVLLDPPVEGILTGRRTRNNGVWESDYSEWDGKSYTYYAIKKSFSSYDVTYNLGKRPLVCLPGDFEVLE